MSKPNNFLMLIGSMKCGTTYLFDLLKQHPKTLGSLEKEPSFFSQPLVDVDKVEKFDLDEYIIMKKGYL